MEHCGLGRPRESPPMLCRCLNLATDAHHHTLLRLILFQRLSPVHLTPHAVICWNTGYYAIVSWFMSVPQSNILSMAHNGGEDFLKSKSLPREYAELTVPNYGVEVPQGVDFSKYNQNRVCKSKQVSVLYGPFYIQGTCIHCMFPLPILLPALRALALVSDSAVFSACCIDCIIFLCSGLVLC